MLTKVELLKELKLVIEDFESKAVTAFSDKKKLYQKLLSELNETKQVLEGESFIMTVKLTNDHDFVRVVEGAKPPFVDADGIVDNNTNRWDWGHLLNERKVCGLWWHEEKQTTVWE